MRNLSRSLTHIRVYKIILRKFVSLLTTTVLLANSYLPYFAYGLQPTIAHADAPPELSVSFDTAKNEFEISVNTASEVEYVFAYTRVKDDGYQVEGLEGKGEDASGIYKKKLYAGTCSAVDCIDHEVKRALVKVQVKDLTWAYEHRYILEENKELSLVGEGKIENDNDVSNLLELTEENTKWLDDVKTSQPSLTPTPTYAPPTSTPTEIPTPTEVITIPTIEVTQAVTETPTLTPTVVEPEHDEVLSVVVQTSSNPVEPSFIETVLSTLLPLLFTDKPDYAPTEKAVISGKEFLPYSTYFITISSSDAPAVSFTDTLTTTGTGTFEYTYQLDGTYRPNYAVEAKDGNGVLVAETSFTDSIYICPFTCQGYNLATGFCVGAQSNGCDAASLGSRICTGSTASCVIYTGPIVQCHTATGWSQGYCREDLRTSCAGDWADGLCPPPPDTDGDGMADPYDNCPSVSNPEQEDDDYDLIGNVCDNCPLFENFDQLDTDGDGVGDTCDNCVNDYNPDQLDSDSNGIGDVCEVVPSPAHLVINEIDYDQPSTDNAEFIEIKNNGQTAVNLDNYEVRTINYGAPPSIGYAFDLPNVSLASGDYFVICAQSGNTPNCDMDVSPDTNLLQQGPDAVALFFKSASSEVLVDTVSYGGDTPGYTEGVYAGTDNGSLENIGLSRFTDGQDTNDNSADFILSCISPGLANTSDADCDKVTVCHSTSAQANPYNVMTPSKSADVQGHDDHNGGVYPSDPWGDIIPPFYYFCESGICTYPGKNWTTEGQAIWNNDCDIPDISPTVTSTPTPTNTPTPTFTPTPTSIVIGGRCGDGTVNQQSELCDDGNQNNDDYCNNQCQPNPNVCLPDVNMLSNGDFEMPVVTNSSKWDIFTMFSPFMGWIPQWLGGVTSYGGDTRLDLANIELHRGVNGWASASGAQHTELDSDWMGPTDSTSGEPASIAIVQNLMTIPGYKYEVMFSYSPRPGSVADDNVLQFDFGSNSQTYGPISSGSVNWTSVTQTYVADSTSTTLRFSDKGIQNSQGMFLDNVSVVCLGPDVTPTPTPIACEEGASWSGNYVSHTQGLRKNGTPITDVARMNPWKAVGPADGQFYSLGYGGTIILELSGYAVDVPNAPDLSFHEVTNGRNSYGVETATVEVSQDGSTWVSIGNVTNKDGGNGIGYLDLNGSGLLWAKYVKITDITSDPALEATADGYDLDAVDVVEQVCEEPKPPTKIIAHKIICENETYLPNWHNGANINANTAQNFVNNSNGKCWFAQDWDFQWGFADKSGQQGVDKLSGEVLGLAAGQSSSGMCNAPYCGPNTQTGTAYNQWKTFGPSNENGVTEALINNLESAPGIWVRESLKANYVPFSYPPQASPGSNVSAEMYCHTDVANYDNFDQIVSPQSGQSYYCVAFNAPVQKDVTICKVDGDDQPLANWTVGLAQQNPLFNDQIPVTNGSGIDASLPAGDHVVFAFGTYRYGNSAMIADAGFSYRPLNIPMGADGWVSGDQLSTVGGLELKVGGQNIAWGGYSPTHQYTTMVSGFAGGNLNLNVWDNQYNDNLNNGNFRAQIHEVLATGVTGDNGCVTLEDVPYGDYVAFELPQANWSHVSTQINGQDTALFPAPVTVSEQDTTVIFENRLVTGQLRVQKTTIPSGDPTEFNVTASGGGQVYGAATGSVTDVADYTFTVEPNTYSVSEDVPSNWEQTSNSCAGILVPSDGERECQITNTQSYDIHGYKWEDVNGNGSNETEPMLSGWEIFIDKNANQTWDTDEPKTTTSNDSAHLGWYWFEDLTAGTYDICEVLQTGWKQTYPLSPSCHSVTLPDMNPLKMAVSQNAVMGPEYNFGNFAKGDMEVMKYEDVDNVFGKSADEQYIGTPTFTFRVYKDVSSVWTKVGESSTDSEGKATFTDVFDTVGSYFVCEIKKDGWEDMRSRNNPANNQSGALDEYAVCDGITVSTSGYMRYAEFGNINKGKITVYKFHDLNGNGTREDGEGFMPDWNIIMDKEGADGLTEQLTGTGGSTEFTLETGSYVLGETQKEGWYQSAIYCENDGEGVKITQPGYAYGHHGACSGWNTCGNAQTCALKACQANGYSNLVSYGDQRPCTQFNNCSLFYDINYDLSYQANWGNWCNVMGVTDIVCNNGSSVTPTPFSTPTPPVGDDQVGLLERILGVSSVFAQVDDDNDSPQSGFTVMVEPGERKTCYIGNYQKATITVNKNVINHVNQDIADDQSFDVYAGESLGTSAFSENSPHSFTVNPGTYTFQETNIDDRYFLDSTVGDEDSGTPNVQITVNSGSSKSVTFVNKKVEPVLQISKFNNKWPTPQAVGAEIQYTIKVDVLGNDMADVKVVDLPPAGFTYKSGSWTASKNGVPYSIPQPVYSSPGTWFLGSLAKGDEVTLTYIATIGSDNKPGVYKDLAWAYGCAESTSCSILNADMILASSEDSTKTDPGVITDTVVGTQIEVPKIGTPGNTINILEKKETGSVLGASSTRRLPATGLSNTLTVFALFQLMLGAVFGLLYFLRKRMKKVFKVGLVIMIVGLCTFIVQPHTHAIDVSEVVVRVEQPKSPANEGFDLGFVALDIMGRQLTARCYVSSSKNSWTFTQFGSDIALKAGGNSGICKVNTGDLAEGDNAYEVRITVLGEPSTPYVKQAEGITVKYIPNSLRPGVPTNYNRQDISSCEKKISFLSADDNGKTVRVEVYRGDTTEFTLNDGTKVGTFNIGSKTPGAHVETVPDCNKKYYYALRAFDAAGNYSDVVGDRVYETVTTTTSGGTTETLEGGSGGTTSGAINVLDSDIPAERETGGQVLGEDTDKTTITPEATPEGDVLGEETSPTQTQNFADAVKETVSSRGAWIVVGSVLILFGILYFVYRKWTGKDTK